MFQKFVRQSAWAVVAAGLTLPFSSMTTQAETPGTTAPTAQDDPQGVQPPRDPNAFYEFYGEKTPDPFRPFQIEKPKNDEERGWVAQRERWLAAQKALLAQTLQPEAERMRQVEVLLEAQLGVAEVTPARKYGAHWFRWINTQEVKAFQIAEAEDGPWKPLVYDDGKLLGDIEVSPDGNTLAMHMLDMQGDLGGYIEFFDLSKNKMYFSAHSGGTYINYWDLGYHFNWGADSQHYYTTVDGVHVLRRPLTRLVTGEQEGHVVQEGPITYEMPPFGTRQDVAFQKYGFDFSNPPLPEQSVLTLPPRLQKNPFEIQVFPNGIEVFRAKESFVDKGGIWVRYPGDDPFRVLIPEGQEQITLVHMTPDHIYAIDYRGPDGAQRIVRFNPDQPEQREVLVPPKTDMTITQTYVQENTLFVRYYRGGFNRIAYFDLKDPEKKGIVPLPPMSSAAVLPCFGAGPNVKLAAGSFTTNEKIYLFNVDTGTLQVAEKPLGPYDLSEAVAEQLEAVSADGTKVPLVVVRPADVKLDGSAALLLYSYGGFGFSLGAWMSPEALAWVKAGGIYAVALPRGGGEFGPQWHENGKGKNKPNTIADLVASIETLQARDYSSPKRTVIYGASHGAMVNLAAMVQRPDLLGAVIAHAGAADMLGGVDNNSEYGNPADSKDIYRVLRGYSPLHNIKPGIPYPPLLLSAGGKDGRVHPWNSMEFAAAMQAANPGGFVLLDYRPEMDHFVPYGDVKSFHEVSAYVAQLVGFAERALGPLDQDAFKATLAPHALKGRVPTFAVPRVSTGP